MTLQEAKDQVSREQYCDNWKVFHMNCIIQGEFQRMDDANDRAAELYAAERYEDGYSAGVNAMAGQV